MTSFAVPMRSPSPSQLVLRVGLLSITLLSACDGLMTRCYSQESIPLWENGAPGFEDRRDEAEEAESYWVKNIHNPTLTAYLPDPAKATGAAVVICPGGGHRLLVFKAEGVEAAEYFNSLGVAAFVLKYRLGREEDSPYEITTHAKQDGLRAMKLVRSRAKEWGIDPSRVGIMGFSAGGEVVSLVSYANSSETANESDATDNNSIDGQNGHPSFQILIYPGPVGVPDVIPSNAPPAFMLVANDDVGASRTIVDLIPKFRQAGVPMEVHIYSRGGHAFNMGNRTKLKTLSTWSARLTDWMQDNFILSTEGRDEYLKELEANRQR